MEAQRLERITIIGGGNWGSAIAKIIGRNVLDREGFDTEVRMWVFQEKIRGKNLTDIINSEHENVKYLPVSSQPLQSAPRVLSRHRWARRASSSQRTSSPIPTWLAPAKARPCLCLSCRIRWQGRRSSKHVPATRRTRGRWPTFMRPSTGDGL